MEWLYREGNMNKIYLWVLISAFALAPSFIFAGDLFELEYDLFVNNQLRELSKSFDSVPEEECIFETEEGCWIRDRAQERSACVVFLSLEGNSDKTKCINARSDRNFFMENYFQTYH